MYGRVHPNQGHVTILFAHDLLSPSGHPHPPIAGNLPIKTLVARRLQTNVHTLPLTHTHTPSSHTNTHTHTPHTQHSLTHTYTFPFHTHTHTTDNGEHSFLHFPLDSPGHWFWWHHGLLRTSRDLLQPDDSCRCLRYCREFHSCCSRLLSLCRYRYEHAVKWESFDGEKVS